MEDRGRRSRRLEAFLKRWGLILGAFEGLMCWLLTRGHAPGGWGVLALLLWYAAVGYLLFPLSSGPHELGHALAARASGVAIQAIRVWPLVLVRDAHGRFRLSVNFDAPGDVAGSVHWSSDHGPPSPATLVRIVGAGPLANGICGLVLGLAGRGVSEGPRTAHGLGALLWAAAAMNLAMMLSSLVPRRASNGKLTDGAELLLLLRRR